MSMSGIAAICVIATALVPVPALSDHHKLVGSEGPAVAHLGPLMVGADGTFPTA
jgi:hypothetical protein